MRFGGLTDIQREMVRALAVEPLDLYMLAATTGEAPFRMRGELQALRRERLVRSAIRRERIVWELTARGERLAHGEQMGLAL